MNDSGTAARLIGTARRSAGISQTALALRAGEPQSVISAYERGRRQPSAMALNRLIEAAGFRLIIVPAPPPSPDLRRASEEFAEALTLAEALPRRRIGPRLDYPHLPS